MEKKEERETELKAEKIMAIHVQCETSMDVKDGINGYLAVIPIVGGTFEGAVKGEVITGGADWNTRKARGAHVFAKYLLRAENGEYIAIENEGVIQDGQKDRIVTAPRFTADENGNYAWLNYGVYVGSLESGKEPGQVEITVYRMK